MKRTVKQAVQQYIKDGVLYTICGQQPAPKTVWRSKHLGKSDSSVARATGRYNHA
jgi:hypothetical protein